MTRFAIEEIVYQFVKDLNGRYTRFVSSDFFAVFIN